MPKRVTTERMSAEGAGPVYEVLTEQVRPGGAANVACNVKSIGGDDVAVTLIGIYGSGYVGLWKKHDVESFTVAGGSVEKNRWVDEATGKYVMRVDDPCGFPPMNVELFEEWFLKHTLDYDAIIVSDYDIGTVTEKIARRVVGAGKLVVVDSKREDLSVFEGCSFLKLNQHEHAVQRPGKYLCPEQLAPVILTKGKDGAEIRTFKKLPGNAYEVKSLTRPSKPAAVVDVTGCGDVFVAALVMSLLRGRDPISAVEDANDAGSEAVATFGTTVIRPKTCPAA
jgi:bifunctional ADP-heptose synthase (sugar kinase/adenylyltransferase)